MIPFRKSRSSISRRRCDSHDVPFLVRSPLTVIDDDVLTTSPTDQDIRRYELFAQNLQQSRSFGSTFKFPEGEGGAAAGGDGAAAFVEAEEDSLYD